MAEAGPIESETKELAGIQAHFRWRAGEGVPTVFVHGNPTHSADWLPFMEACSGGVLALDLPGFGRSERPSPDLFAGGMHDHADWLERVLDQLEVGDFNLVVHDWGGLALIAAARRPERVRRLVVINAVPLLAAYRWHWIARIWRRRGAGEAFNALTTRRALALLLRLARADNAAMPDDFIEMIWGAWDRGMAAAILRLYRSADPEALEAAGAHLDRLEGPTLVLWGQQDPYLGPEVGRAYAERLPAAELVEIDDAGHWPWIDQPQLIGRVCEFLEG